MKETRDYSAATVEQALELACSELGAQEADLAWEVVDEGSKKIFGLGAERPVIVRITLSPEAVDPKALAREILEVSIDQAPDTGERHTESLDPELSDEELDQVADTAIEVLREVLKYFGAEDVTIEEYEGDEGEIILDVVGADLAVLIGRHGRTLESVQALVSAIVSRRLGFRFPVVVDIEGYRHRRRQKIDAMARSAADRASRQRSLVRMRPMTPYERRIVHMCLRDDSRVLTESDGAEPNRCVVVKPRQR